MGKTSSNRPAASTGQADIRNYTHSTSSPQAGNRTVNNKTGQQGGPGTTSNRARTRARTKEQQEAADRDPEYRKVLEEWDKRQAEYEERAERARAQQAANRSREENPDLSNAGEPMQVEPPAASQASADSGVSTSTGTARPAGATDTGGTGAPPPAKKPNMATGTSTPGGSGADVGGSVVIRDANAASRGKMTFKHAFQVQTPSLQFQAKPFHVTNALMTGTRGLATPLCSLDPDNLALYMTPVEYAQLPLNCWATGCRIKVTPLGYRAPFATNDPSSVFANSQTVVQIAHGIGLNKILNGFCCRYSISTQDPTEVSSFDAGTDLPADADLYQTAAACGEPIWWNCFYTPIVEEGDVFPNLSRFIDVQNINDTKGLPVVDYEYNFKNGRLKGNQYTCQNWRQWAGIIPEGFNTVNPSYRSTNRYNVASAQAANSLSINGVGLAFGNLDSSTLQSLFGYHSRIEKAAFVQNNAGNQQTPDSPPLVHFGVMPLSSNTSMPTYKYSPLIAVWEIQCELDVEYSTNYISSNQPVELLQSCDMIVDSQLDSNMASCLKPFFSISGRRCNKLTYVSERIGTTNLVLDVKYPKTLPTLLSNTQEIEDTSDSE